MVLVTDDNPRTEDPAEIRAEVLAGAYAAGTAAGSSRWPAAGPPSTRRSRWPSRATWSRVLGKGHERGQEMAGEVLPFDDRIELAGGAARPVRRPGGSAVIALTLAEVAAGGRRPARRRRPGRRRSPARSSSTRARWRPGGLFVAFAGEKVDGHDYAATAIAAGAVAVLGTREVPGVPMVLVDDALAAMGAAGPRGGGPAARADRDRDHRLVRQDHHQGPDRAAHRPARADGGAARLVQQRAGAPVHGAAGRPAAPATWCWRRAPGGRARALPVRASRRRGSPWCSTSAWRTSASSARWTPSPRPRASWSRRCRPTGWPCSTPTTRGSTRWRAAPPPGWCATARRPTPTCGPWT